MLVCEQNINLKSWHQQIRYPNHKWLTIITWNNVLHEAARRYLQSSKSMITACFKVWVQRGNPLRLITDLHE